MIQLLLLLITFLSPFVPFSVHNTPSGYPEYVIQNVYPESKYYFLYTVSAVGKREACYTSFNSGAPTMKLACNHKHGVGTKYYLMFLSEAPIDAWPQRNTVIADVGPVTIDFQVFLPGVRVE